MSKPRSPLLYPVLVLALLTGGILFDLAFLASALDLESMALFAALASGDFVAAFTFTLIAGLLLVAVSVAVYLVSLDPFRPSRPRFLAWLNFVPLAAFAGLASGYLTLEMASSDQSPAVLIGFGSAFGLLLPLLILALEMSGGWALGALGRKADDTARPVAAYRCLMMSLRWRPSGEATIRRCGLLLVDLEEFGCGRELLERLEPPETSDDLDLIRALERTYRAAKDDARIIQCVRRHRELRPESKGIDRDYLDLCLKLGDKEEAIAILESNRVKMDMKMLATLQRLYTETGNVAQAMARARQVAEMESAPFPRSIALYRDLLDSLSGNVELMIQLGELLQRAEIEELMEEGAQLLESAIELDPGRLHLRRGLGEYFLRTLQHERAEGQYRQLIDEADMDPETYLRFAEMLKSEDRPGDALGVYRGMQENCDDDWRGFEREAELLIEADRLDEAEKAIDGAEALAPGEARPGLHEQRRRIALLREEKSLEALSAEIERDGADPARRLEYIRQLVSLDRTDRLVVECDKLIEETPGLMPEVEKILEGALPTLEQSFRVRDYLSDLYFREARFDDMLAMYQQMSSQSLDPNRVMEEGCKRILARAPGHADARIALSEVYLRTSRWKQVLRNYETMIEDPPGEEALRIRSQWTLAAYEAGKLEEAAEQGLAILPEMGEDAEFLIMMIRLLEDLGDYERAYTVFRAAHDRFPENEDLRKMESSVADRNKRSRMETLQDRDERDLLTPEEHYEKGDLHRQFDQQKQAIVHFQLAAEKPGLHDLAMAKMTVCLCDRRMFELADETLDPIELTRDKAQHHRELKPLFYRVAAIMHEENYLPQAQKYFKRLFRIDAAYRDVVRRLEKLDRG